MTKSATPVIRALDRAVAAQRRDAPAVPGLVHVARGAGAPDHDRGIGGVQPLEPPATRQEWLLFPPPPCEMPPLLILEQVLATVWSLLAGHDVCALGLAEALRAGKRALMLTLAEHATPAHLAGIITQE